MALSEYLNRASQQRWEWGKHDCCQFVRRWVEEATGRDPAAGWRYSTELGAALLANRNGGILGLFQKLADEAGLEATSDPGAEDIGVIAVLSSEGIRPVGAICTGAGWAFTTDTGLHKARGEPLAAWRVHG